MCDIGGGRGHVAMALLDKHPHLSVVLQDLPRVIDDAEKVCDEMKVGHMMQTLMNFAADLAGRQAR